VLRRRQSSNSSIDLARQRGFVDVYSLLVEHRQAATLKELESSFTVVKMFREFARRQKLEREVETTLPVVSCPVLSCPVLSCPVLSCPVLSCPVLSCPVLSCRVVLPPHTGNGYVLQFKSQGLIRAVRRGNRAGVLRYMCNIRNLDLDARDEVSLAPRLETHSMLGFTLARSRWCIVSYVAVRQFSSGLRKREGLR
jgi:hypothetical protein